MTLFLRVMSIGLARADTLEGGIFVVQFSPASDELPRYTLGELEKGLAKYDAYLPPGEAPITVNICRTAREFRHFAGRGAMASIQGFSRSEEGVVVVKAPGLMRSGADYGGVLRHELLHVLLARNTNLDNLPRWLNEGIAMTISGENRWSSALHIGQMYAQGTLIEYGRLPFAFAAPGDETEFGRAYSQSLSMTKFLRKLLGETSFWELLRDMESQSFNDALAEKAGLTTIEFYKAWKGSLWKFAVTHSLLTGVGAFQFAAVLVIIVYLRKRRRAKRILRQWELEGTEEPGPWEEDP
ncbi:MAG: hypothetical protein QGG73_03025 [Candidatus Hydrogenedentes bacterium]|nr:hypothetical protein [Candidatus Hydrogenedentota bacterium]